MLLTPAEVAADVSACWEIGITSVHLHARDEDGVPTWRLDVYQRLVGAVRATNMELVEQVHGMLAVLGRPVMTPDQLRTRLEPS